MVTRECMAEVPAKATSSPTRPPSEVRPLGHRYRRHWGARIAICRSTSCTWLQWCACLAMAIVTFASILLVVISARGAEELKRIAEDVRGKHNVEVAIVIADLSTREVCIPARSVLCFIHCIC